MTMSKTARIEAVYPLTPMQEGMLFHTLEAPGSGAYVEQLVCSIEGDVDLDAFQRAWDRAVERHGILRTAFALKGSEKPLQVVLHAILDGWSLGLLFPEVLASYRAFRAGREPEQASVGPYREFIVWLQGRDAAVLTTRGASKRRACRGCSGT